MTSFMLLPNRLPTTRGCLHEDVEETLHVEIEPP